MPKYVYEYINNCLTLNLKLNKICLSKLENADGFR